jgi:hypothetical protein
MPNRSEEDPTLKELRAIKRVLALIALKQGATHEEIGVALQVDRSVVSRMLPGVRAKRD